MNHQTCHCMVVPSEQATLRNFWRNWRRRIIIWLGIRWVWWCCKYRRNMICDSRKPWKRRMNDVGNCFRRSWLRSCTLHSESSDYWNSRCKDRRNLYSLISLTYSNRLMVSIDCDEADWNVEFGTCSNGHLWWWKVDSTTISKTSGPLRKPATTYHLEKFLRIIWSAIDISILIYLIHSLYFFKVSFPDTSDIGLSW